MFHQRKGKAEICDVNDFHVRYVGKAETFVAARKGCTHDVVQKIWDNSEDEYLLRRLIVSISRAGLTLTDIDNKKFDMTIPIKDISHCCAERSPHERIFTWISKNKKQKRLECHAVICSSKEKAQTMAVLLHRAFQVAYVDWKSKRETKMKARQTSTESEPGTARQSSDDGASTSSTGSNDVRIPFDHVDYDDEYANEMLSQMNIVEENEISFTANNITINPEREEMSTWT